MTIKLYMLATLGVTLGILWILAIAYNVYRIRTGQKSFSRLIVERSATHPLFSPFIGIVVGFTVGLLFGHWWWPLTEHKDE